MGLGLASNQSASGGDRVTPSLGVPHQYGLQAYGSQAAKQGATSNQGESQMQYPSNLTSNHENFDPNMADNYNKSAELDPYAPSLVQDLLTGANEWRNIQDIIKLTLKAVCDVVRSQGLAIRELERVIPTKCNKSELNAGLSLKANVSDVSRTVADVAASIDTKLSLEEV